MQPTPAQLIGLPVLDPGGAPLGVVEDVGLAAWDQPKFLLVRFRLDQQHLVRVELRDVAELGAAAVRLDAAHVPTPA